MSTAVGFLDRDYNGYFNISKDTRSIRFKQETFNNIIKKFRKFRLEAEDKFVPFNEQIFNASTSLENNEEVSVSEPSLSRKEEVGETSVITRLKEEIVFLSKEILPKGNVKSRAIKLKSKMIQNLRANVDSIGADELSSNANNESDMQQEQDNSIENGVVPISPEEVKMVTDKENSENEILISKAGKPAKLDIYEYEDKTPEENNIFEEDKTSEENKISEEDKTKVGKIGKIDFDVPKIELDNYYNYIMPSLNENVIGNNEQIVKEGNDTTMEERFLFEDSSVEDISKAIDKADSFEEIRALMNRVVELKRQQEKSQEDVRESTAEVESSLEGIKTSKEILAEYAAALTEDVEFNRSRAEENRSNAQRNRDLTKAMLDLMGNQAVNVELDEGVRHK